MRARLSVMLVTAFVMLLASFQAPAAWAYPRGDEVDPNEGEPKHEINELQNRLHHTDDPSKENHIEGKIDTLQEQRLESFGLGDLGCGGFGLGGFGCGGLGCGFGFGGGFCGFAPPVW
ncbi:MAG: hypothetical protein M3N45_01855 [Actinomycetota bacterium]|nr:hypothetical protein [Actinomycetota bacterium]